MPLDLQHSRRLRVGIVLHQLIDLVRDQDLPAAGVLLQSPAYVHCVTDDGEIHHLRRADIPHEHLARVHSHTKVEARGLGKLLVRLLDRTAQPPRCPHSPLDVILLSQRRVEIGKHPIAEELVHRPSLSQDRLGRHGDVIVEHLH